jgi:signal transduction histidine kinase
MEEVRLSLFVSPDCLASGSRAQLEEAITNILSNAIKYTSGCARKEVEIRLSRGEVLHELQVNDTGIGMSKEQTQHIFDRYYRASLTATQKGHGLGMAITKRIIDQHHGTIAVESQPGAGSRVLIFIPAASRADD